MKDINIALLSDTQGNDDEGMKKISRKLSSEINEFEGINLKLVNLRGVFSEIKDLNVIHFIGGPSYKTLILILIFRILKRNVKSVLTFTNPFWGKRADWLFKIIKPEYSIALSDKWFDEISKKGGRIDFLCVSGVDVNKFKPVSADTKKHYRNNLGLPSGKIVLLHVGHIKADRNISYLKEFQSDNVQVVVVGSTTTEKSTELKRSLEAAGVIVVDNYIENIEQYYQASDCYIFPTRDERGAVQVPLSILEALATNLPVLSTDFGGVKRLFSDCRSVKYIELFDHDTVLNTVQELIDGEKDGATYIKKFTWEVIAGQLVSTYKELTKK